SCKGSHIQESQVERLGFFSFEQKLTLFSIAASPTSSLNHPLKVKDIPFPISTIPIFEFIHTLSIQTKPPLKLSTFSRLSSLKNKQHINLLLFFLRKFNLYHILISF
ncbi:hypothetical protein AB4523_23220, partial [Vibrio splendidus]